MLNHVVPSWCGSADIAVFHLFDIDAAFFLSSAGFIGAAVAIGGQHKVNDYLTGLSVLFEDRYGVGDELVVEVPGRRPLHAVVDHIGLVTTRLRDEHEHVARPERPARASSATSARKRRLDGPAARARRRRLDTNARPPCAAERWPATEQLTDVVFVGDLAARRTTMAASTWRCARFARSTSGHGRSSSSAPSRRSAWP